MGAPLMRKSKRPKAVRRVVASTSEPEVELGLLVHPLTCLAAISVALTALLHWLFFRFAPAIWAMGENVRPEDITSWARGFTSERDGMEPQALLLLVLALIALTAVATYLLEKRLRGLRSEER